MIKRSKHIQNDPLAKWEITLPESNGKEARALAAYDSEGKTILWDSAVFDGSKLIVDFGIDPVSGSLNYEYESQEQEGSNGSPLVNINNNYGGIQVSPGSFRS